MSGEAIGWAFRKVQMDDPTAKLVLVAICNYANEEDQAWPSHARIVERTGLSKRAVQANVKKLEDWGVIVRERRVRPDGSETSAMISIDIDRTWIIKGGVASVATPSVQQVPEGVAAGAPLDKTLKPQEKNPRPAKQDGYSEEFENLVWKPYPRKAGTSKKIAFQKFQKLSRPDQELTIKSIPIFAAKMKAEARTEDKIRHLETYINGRVFETMAPTASEEACRGPETASRYDWAVILLVYRSSNNWRLTWGPEPGRPGCHVPADMLTMSDADLRAIPKTKM